MYKICHFVNNFPISLKNFYTFPLSSTLQLRVEQKLESKRISILLTILAKTMSISFVAASHGRLGEPPSQLGLPETTDFNGLQKLTIEVSGFNSHFFQFIIEVNGFNSDFGQKTFF